VLALFGAGDAQEQGSDKTNVLSHALGFLMGALAGGGVATVRGGRWLQRMPGWAATAMAAGPVLVAWTVALVCR